MALSQSKGGLPACPPEADSTAGYGLPQFCRDFIAQATWSELGRRALHEIGVDPDCLTVHDMGEGEALDMACNLLAVAVALWRLP